MLGIDFSKDVYYKVLVFLIIVLGAHLRFSAAINSEVIAPLRADAAQYYSYAFNLKEHGVYSRAPIEGQTHRPTPDSLRPPGYPVYLLPFVEYPVTEQTLLNIYISQAAISVVAVVFFYMTLMNFLPKYWALLGTALMSISPHLINSNIYVLSESLFGFLVILIVWWISKFSLQEKSHRKLLIYYAVLGALFALATLIRPTTSYIYLFLIPVILFIYGKNMRAAHYSLVFIMVFFAIQSPWMIRNSVSSTEDAHQLAVTTIQHGMYPNFMYNDDERTYGYPYRYDPENEQLKNIDYLVGSIAQNFIERPVKYIKWYLIEKPLTLFSWGSIQGMGGPFIYEVKYSPYMDDVVFKLSNKLIFYFEKFAQFIMFFGIVVVWVPCKYLFFNKETVISLRIASVFMLYYVSVHIAGAPFPRYGFPMRPMLFLFTLVPTYIAYNYISMNLNKICQK